MGNLLYDIPFIPFVLLMIVTLVASVINLKKLKRDEPQKRPWCSMIYVTMLGVPVLTVARCLHDFSKTYKYSDIAGTMLLVYLFVFIIVLWVTNIYVHKKWGHTKEDNSLFHLTLFLGIAAFVLSAILLLIYFLDI